MKVKSVGNQHSEIDSNNETNKNLTENEKQQPVKSPSSFNLSKAPIIIGALVILLGCLAYFVFIYKGDKINSTTESNVSESDQKRIELELKEKELNQRENKLKSNNSLSQQNLISQINLLGSYVGSIKDGTQWYVNFTSFDGRNLSGYNVIYWKSSPEGFQTSFIGTYDPSTKEILMFEDKNAKGAGKFIGKVSSDGNSLSGNWYRYKDNGSFTWDLHKSN